LAEDIKAEGVDVDKDRSQNFNIKNLLLMLFLAELRTTAHGLT